MGKRTEKSGGQRHWVYYAALAAAVIVLAVAAVMLLRGRGSPKELRGTWIYDSTTEYTFDGEKSGAMRVQGTDYAFTYRVRGSVVTLTFEHDAIETANYRYWPCCGRTSSRSGTRGRCCGCRRKSKHRAKPGATEKINTKGRVV